MATIDTLFEQWKSNLLDLSKRNRLLFFKSTKRGNLPLVEPGAREIFSWLVGEEKNLAFAQNTQGQLELDLTATSELDSAISVKSPPLRPGEIKTNLTDEQLTATLYNIRSKARTALEEQGINVLYLTFGMLEWYESESSDEKIRSPLILVPVELLHPSITKPYSINLLDEDIILNPTLLHKMQADFGLALNQLPEDWESSSLETFLQQIKETIQRQPRWSVSAEVYLGLFSFEKLVMMKDLETNAATAKSHPIILGLAGDRSRIADLPTDLPQAEELDDRITPQETFQVLDADSSQQEAILRAKRGVSFVIQGPPGTGKSQTIANIIAESLAQGKKILFVSQKSAALEVVKKRLDECGLGEFCLEAHSHRAKKAEVIKQLGSTLTSATNYDQPVAELELTQLHNLRTNLNEYVKALHTQIKPLYRTAYYAHGQLAKLHDASDLVFSIATIAEVGVERLTRMLSALNNLVALGEVWDNLDTHPWRGTLVEAFGFQLQTDIQYHFAIFIESLNDLEKTTAELAAILGVKKPTTLTETNAFLEFAAFAVQTPAPPEDWLANPNIAELRRVATEAQEVFQKHNSNTAKLLAVHTESIFAVNDVPDLIARFETTYRSVLRFFNSNFKRDIRIIQSTAVGGHKIGYTQALSSLHLLLEIQATRKWIEAKSSEHMKLFGRFYNGLETEWQQTLSGLEWTETLLAYFLSQSPPIKLRNLVCNDPEKATLASEMTIAIRDILSRVQDEKSFFGQIFPIDRMKIEGTHLDNVNFSVLKERIQVRLDRLPELKNWTDFESARKACLQEGLDSFINAAAKARLSSQQLIHTFLRRFYKLWLDAVYTQFPILGRFNSDQQTRLIDQFRKLDQSQLTLARRRITSNLMGQRPKSAWVDAPSSEVVILQNEIAKKRRHKPIRKLFAQIPNLLLRLKPCLMMSPLSVSQFLSLGNFAFDIVIFDEASQVCPEDSITSIMRGGQTVVAGDQQQLPPTPFFKSLGIEVDEWNEESPQDMLESILQQCWTFLPQQPLQWHYRSRHESLIAFSNFHFYNNRLITFPNSRSEGEELGIELVHIPDGIYDRGKSRKNRVEAQHVAELIINHFTQFPQRSLGVVAFSEAQREAIEEELYRLVREKPEYEPILNNKGPDAFFVKNLENVQGDERDVMFFSVGYGKELSGKMSLNFGPLNGEDGARRLNVAITRARYHVKLVSSILPENIDSASKNRGVQLLRYYLEYARQKGKRESLSAETDVSSQGDTDSPFEDAVYDVLTARGLILHKQVGCSDYRIDFGVVDPENPGRYLIGIECDGATYHSAATARDRDRLRQQVLEGLGWRIHRIWSRDWFSNPNPQTEKILAAVALAKQLVGNPLNIPIAVREDKIQKDELELPNSTKLSGDSDSAISKSFPAGVETYALATLPRQGISEQFYRASSGTIAQLIHTLIEKEGPVHFDYTWERIADCWGIARAGRNVRENIRFAAKELASKNEIEIRGEFLWPINQVKLIVRRPAVGDSPRPIEEIPIEELAQAVYICLQDAFSLTEHDLTSQTAGLLGYDRIGAKVKVRIENAISNLIASGRVATVDGKISIQNK